MAQSYVLPLHVSTYDFGLGPTSIGKSMVTNAGLSTIAWVANLSQYIPVFIPWPYPVNRVWWINGSTASSNVNFGIFHKTGRLIFETGTVAQSGASVIQYSTPGTPFILGPGAYYFAIACDGTTNRLAGSTSWTTLMLKHMGVLEQTSNFALADPATFATPANAVFWAGGVTRTTSGF